MSWRDLLRFGESSKLPEADDIPRTRPATPVEIEEANRTLTDKTEPTMEEILASIRRIISDTNPGVVLVSPDTTPKPIKTNPEITDDGIPVPFKDRHTKRSAILHAMLRQTLEKFLRDSPHILLQEIVEEQVALLIECGYVDLESD